MVETTACVCGTIGNPAELRFCAEHHAYWWSDKRLTGVTSVIKDCFPATYDGVAPDVLENARDRGTQLDALVSAYVVGKLTEIPAGTRYDAIDLFEKFQKWWDRQRFNPLEVSSQVAVHDDELAGTIDIWTGEIIWDVKCTYDLLPSHRLQVAGYSELGGGPAAMLIHVTKRFSEPKIVEVESREDWYTVRAFWRLKRRLATTAKG